MNPCCWSSIDDDDDDDRNRRCARMSRDLCLVSCISCLVSCLVLKHLILTSSV